MQHQTLNTPTFAPRRAAGVFLGLIGCFLALMGRVAYLQTYGRQQTIRRRSGSSTRRETLPARRGSIFDPNGMLMAGTVQTQTLFVDPKFMQDCFQEEGHSLVEMDEAVDQAGAS